MIQGAGDFFVYPVSSSPYFANPIFRTTQKWMHFFHHPFVMIAFLGCVMVWFPMMKKVFTNESLFAARFCSLLLIYYTIIHMIGAPFPRYSVPLRPYLYGAVFFLPYVLLAHNRKTGIHPRTAS